MTTLPTPLDRHVEAPLKVTGLRPLAVTGALVALGLTAASLTGDDLVAGSWVRAGLVAAWGAAALVLLARGPERLAVVAASGALAGGACAATASSADLAFVHAVAAALVPAIALHLEVVVPDGAVARPAHRNLVITGYVVALAVGVALGAADRVPSVPAVAASTIGALLVGLPVAHQRYRTATGMARQRLQLVGCATAIIVEVALVVAALRLLVEWPDHAGEVAAAATVLVPLALAAGTSTKISRNVDRLLVHTVSATGLTAVVVLVYLVIVIGLGRAPADDERTLLVLSMVAAAVASLAYVPARERLSESANRLVYG
ncbi:MAG: hypothetical protein ACRDYW_00845, partial [Acidimicrobiales bacterium]